MNRRDLIKGIAGLLAGVPWWRFGLGKSPAEKRLDEMAQQVEALQSLPTLIDRWTCDATAFERGLITTRAELQRLRKQYADEAPPIPTQQPDHRAATWKQERKRLRLGMVSEDQTQDPVEGPVRVPDMRRCDDTGKQGTTGELCGPH